MTLQLRHLLQLKVRYFNYELNFTRRKPRYNTVRRELQSAYLPGFFDHAVALGRQAAASGAALSGAVL
jgi:hypothetical protein